MKRILTCYFLFFLCPLGLRAQHYVLYGEATQGGLYNHGTLFRFDPFTGKDTVLYNFNGSDGDMPARSLYLSSNKTLYGACDYGGTNDEGIMFKYDLMTGNVNSLINFADTNGSIPFVGLISNGGNLYGTTGYGGKYNGGVIFCYNISFNIYTITFNFNDTIGAVPYGGLFILNDSSFYGMTGAGGQYNAGTIYKFNPLTKKLTLLYNFNANIDGTNSQGTFIKYYNGLLYGMTGDLGPGEGGVLLSFNPATNTETDLIDFNDSLGSIPFGELYLATDSLLYGMTSLGGSKNDGVLFSYNVKTNAYNIVINFDSVHGKLGTGGNVIEDTANKILYGMTVYGGSYNGGVIFSYNLITKKDSILFNFNNTSGVNPYGTLLMVPDSVIGLGIQELNYKEVTVNIYPNPNNGNFTIAYNVGNVMGCKVELYDAIGESVGEYTLANSEGTMNISNPMLANGVYLWKIYSGKQVLKYGKVIIMK